MLTLFPLFFSVLTMMFWAFVLIRVLMAFLSWGYFVPDETWQSVEVAHKLGTLPNHFNHKRDVTECASRALYFYSQITRRLPIEKNICRNVSNKPIFPHFYIIQFFSADATMFLNLFKFFFAPENMKNPPPKVGNNS